MVQVSCGLGSEMKGNEMHENINTIEYWENRFLSGDWETKQGRWQTKNFAIGQIPYLNISRDFTGTIMDFGCGLGDAMPVYRKYFPQANLIGIDISATAIELCRKHFGSIATFIQGDCNNIPPSDVIIASNVFEHLTDDLEVAKILLHKCRFLKIVVPYKEWPLCLEHVNIYNEKYFSELGEYDWQVFPCRGWSLYGKKLWKHVYVKNIFRFILRRQVRHRRKQIMFHPRGFHR